ncbi:hypothetical protein GQ42DRAFT_164038 [Ramicandelaber brevisporus]|nr:hypothetical protein GQ42DRAFT_164038 [Ramicandelaber brevisporus]
MLGSAAARQQFYKNWYRHEIIPLYAVITVAVGGASWYVYRLSQGSEVVFDRRNKTPWLDVKQDQNLKMLDPEGNFQKYIAQQKQ